MAREVSAGVLALPDGQAGEQAAAIVAAALDERLQGAEEQSLAKAPRPGE